MKTLIMLSSREGAPDGIRTQWYVEGETYVVPDYLADIFLKEGWAEEIEPPESQDETNSASGETVAPQSDAQAVSVEPVASKAETRPAAKKEYSGGKKHTRKN